MEAAVIGFLLLLCAILSMLLIKKDEKIIEYSKVYSKDFPILKENIWSIIDFLHTQDVSKFISHTEDPEKGELAIRFLEDSLRIVARNGFMFSDIEENDSRFGSVHPDYLLRICRAAESVLKSTKDDPSSYRKSNNPITVVLSIWNDMNNVVDSIISDYSK